MLKQIDETKQIMTEKILGTKAVYDTESQTYSVLFGTEVKQNKYAENTEQGYAYYVGVIADIMFKTVEEANKYAKVIMNTDIDYNDVQKIIEMASNDIKVEEVIDRIEEAIDRLEKK